jgi:NAD(P)-dependent dehydrogenase (short-subunit alcohol dehydrogenase family)
MDGHGGDPVLRRHADQLIAAQTTPGRVGRPDDIGSAIAMLLSPGVAWITGQRIEVSGGMML